MGVPGIPIPLPLPVPLVVPVINDTGDSASNDVDQRTFVYVDVENQRVLDAESFARAVGQSIIATLLVLLGVALVILAVAFLLFRRKGGSGPAAPGPGGPPVPGPGGTWVYYPPGTPGVPPTTPPPGPEEWPPPSG